MIESFILYLFFFPPIILASYTMVYVGAIVFLSALFFTQKVIINNYVKRYLVWIIFLVLGAFNTVMYSGFDGIWVFRDMIKPIIILLFLLYVYSYLSDKDIEKKLENIYKIFIFFLIINGTFAAIYLVDRSLLKFLNIYINSETILIEQYYRFMGLYGNPNMDGLVFGYGLILLLSIMYSRKSKSMIIAIAIFLTGIGIFAAGSRTVWIAILIVIPLYMMLTKIHIKNIIFILLLLVLVYFILNSNQEIYNRYISRFTTMDSYGSNTRIDIVLEYIKFFSNNLISFVVGNMAYVSSKFLNTVDNDYIMIILKYGVIGLFFILGILVHMIILGVKLFKKRYSENIRILGSYLILSTVYTLIVAITTAPIGQPKIFLLNLIFYIFGLKIDWDIKKYPGIYTSKTRKIKNSAIAN